MNERILALDVGDARIGIAVSDMSRTIATPVEVLHRVGWGPDVKRILELCRQYDTTLVLSGMPLNMDGSTGFQAEKVMKFCEQLEKNGLTVYYQDERLTTVTAEHALLEGNMHRMERRQHVDKVAAAIILQQWLDSQRTAATMDDEADEADEGGNSMQENMDHRIELVDEDGETVLFDHLATVEHEGEYYIMLSEIEDEALETDDEGEVSVVIMKIEQDDEGNDCYVCVEDEALQEVLFNKFVAMMDEAEDEDGE